MNTTKLVTSTLVLSPILSLVAGLALAQDSEPQAGPAAPSGLGTAFTYQGRLEDAAGQPDAGLLAGGGYTLGGGFWGGGSPPAPVYDHALYLPLVLRAAR